MNNGDISKVQKWSLFAIVILFAVGIIYFINFGKGSKLSDKDNTDINDLQQKEEQKQLEKQDKTISNIKIIDENSNSRPYAIMINNYPGAMKVQAGLNDAYMIYEFPIEGGYSRSVAVFKDKTTEKIGTVRSARQYHPYYALEHDAIYVHWGTNHPAADVISELKINHIDANSNSKPFFRENPEKLATEHTGYTSLKKLISFAKDKNMKQTTDVKPPLKYSSEVIDLSKYSDSKVANTITLNYSGSYKLKYKYNSETQRYERYYNDKLHKDYFTKEKFDTKNIIVAYVKIGTVGEYKDTAGTNYLDMTVTGSGKGYYITNGYAREITWNKETKKSQTVYKYLDGTEINVNDGNTYVNFFNKSKDVGIK